MDNVEESKQTVLITGASSGIGNKFSVLLSRLIPRSISANIVRKVQYKLLIDYKD
jgi:short-subunit dehydrogenase involved in D-alanine esterification of teichoic acids